MLWLAAVGLPELTAELKFRYPHFCPGPFRSVTSPCGLAAVCASRTAGELLLLPVLDVGPPELTAGVTVGAAAAGACTAGLAGGGDVGPVVKAKFLATAPLCPPACMRWLVTHCVSVSGRVSVSDGEALRCLHCGTGRRGSCWSGGES